MKIAGSFVGFLLISFSMFMLLLTAVVADRPNAPLGFFVIAGIIMLIAGIAFARVSSGKSCPDCSEKVKSRANVCRHCGHNFI